MSKYVLPLIRSAGGGAVVNISSIHAFATSTGVAPYAAAKGGVLALTRTMALDLAPDNIRVISIHPGATNTPMLQQHAQREGKTLAELGFPTSDNALVALLNLKRSPMSLPSPCRAEQHLSPDPQ